ncbi:MAG: amidohydrolase [Verrucomicrobia bacterium]|nr:amidohydrolase [Verrucomicrobiota bacterium]
MKPSRLLATALAALALPAALFAQKTKPEITAQIDATKKTYEDIALKIWGFAEVGYKETQSSGLLQSTLKAAGFSVQAGVADMPTAFVASYGSGSPVIGILAEFDALPGVSQTADPEKKARPEVNAGHACGHHLFGTASTDAAITLKAWMQATGQKGTLRVYGTPAEEGGSGKIYMVRAGLFNDVDAVLHWHAGDRNAVRLNSSLANKSGKFRFHGIAAHAAASPERGRSALDGVEAMDHMVNMMREHVPDSTRIHYVITKGGEAPNVVPAFAEVYYYVRSPSRDIVVDVWDRVTKAAQGAAMGTGTTVDWEITGGVYELLPNETLARAMQANLETVGGVPYTAEEKVFAEKIGRTLFGKAPAVETAAMVQPFDPKSASSGGGSTDVSDVSWVTPTVGMNAATWVPGTPAHSWQAVAAGGTGIGLKGMIVAAKTIALTGVDLFTQPELIAKAKAELLKRRGPDFKYECVVGNRKPPLDYRD